MRRIGVLGGTFDPVHHGHLAIAGEARQQLALTEVIFMPAGQPYFKNLKNISNAQYRLRMLQLALTDMPFYRISLLEIEKPGPSYAVESMSKMRSEMQPGEELYFIIGWDALAHLPEWHQAENLITICSIIAAPRPGFVKPDIALMENKLPGITQRCTLLERPLIDISSSDIRRRVAESLPINHMVPAAVEKYIQDTGLYLPTV